MDVSGVPFRTVFGGNGFAAIPAILKAPVALIAMSADNTSVLAFTVNNTADEGSVIEGQNVRDQESRGFGTVEGGGGTAAT